MDRHHTKKRILDEALTLFSQQGYEAVRVSQIAMAIGIKAPSLYKHYESKQHIFDAIVEEMDTRYGQLTKQMQFDGTDADKDQNVFLHIDETTLIGMAKQIFLFFIHDDYMSKFRKMLTIEQFHNIELANYYTKLYVLEPLQYQSTLFAEFVKYHAFIDADPDTIALHFYAPMYVLITMCDREPSYETHALQQIEKHIHQFSQLYTNQQEVIL